MVHNAYSRSSFIFIGHYHGLAHIFILNRALTFVFCLLNESSSYSVTEIEWENLALERIIQLINQYASDTHSHSYKIGVCYVWIGTAWDCYIYFHDMKFHRHRHHVRNCHCKARANEINENHCA